MMNDDIGKKMRLQSAEFDAANKFAAALHTHNNVAVVDDDYPQVRQQYESTLAALINALKENGRFDMGNRHGLTVVYDPYANLGRDEQPPPFSTHHPYGG